MWNIKGRSYVMLFLQDCRTDRCRDCLLTHENGFGRVCVNPYLCVSKSWADVALANEAALAPGEAVWAENGLRLAGDTGSPGSPGPPADEEML